MGFIARPVWLAVETAGRLLPPEIAPFVE
jgi:hypothetical protein